MIKIDFEIVPLKGVGVLTFGLPSNVVRRLLNCSYTTFKRTPEMEVPCDFFEDLGLFAYYKKTGELEALEFSGPISPTYIGESFLGRDVAKLTQTFQKLDPDLEVDSYGFVSHRFGLGVFTSGNVIEQSVVEGLIVFEEDYYSHES